MNDKINGIMKWSGGLLLMNEFKRKEFVNYIPYDEQEESDKEYIF